MNILKPYRNATLRRSMFVTCVLVAVAVGFGCGQPRPGGPTVAPSDSSKTAASRTEVPFEGGFYSGILPCASCPGIRTEIVFSKDGTYRRRRTYLDGAGGTDRSVGDYGQWRAGENHRVMLKNTDGERTQFEIVGADEIGLLDSVGRPVETELNYSLVRRSEEPAKFGPVAMSGMYTYFADAAIFKPCSMEETIPVAMVEAHVDLEHAYMKERPFPGAPVFVRIDARIEERPIMEGDRSAKAVIVTRVIDVDSRQSCKDQKTP